LYAILQNDSINNLDYLGLDSECGKVNDSELPTTDKETVIPNEYTKGGVTYKLTADDHDFCAKKCGIKTFQDALDQLSDPNSCLSKCLGEKADAGLWKEYLKEELPDLIKDILGRRVGIRGGSGIRPLTPKGPRYPGGAGRGGSGRGDGGGRGRGGRGRPCDSMGEIKNADQLKEVLGDQFIDKLSHVFDDGMKICLYRCPRSGLQFRKVALRQICPTIFE
jgi:hypothetical protein